MKNKIDLKFILLPFVLICSSYKAFPLNQSYKVLGPQSNEDVSQQYFYDLLEAALQQVEKSSSLEVIDATTITQGRTLHLLSNNVIDIYWMGTTPQREEQFFAIKIPLLKGLLGYRVSIIHKNNLNKFQNLSSKELQSLLACQGQHWPDTKILKANGYNVAAVANFKSMFDMVSKQRCDYFPRAIFEGYGEHERASSRLSGLLMFDDTILYYPFPIYFFVRLEDKKLGKIIERGLERMIDSGEFDKFIEEHEVTKHLFPISKWSEKKFIRLSNPFINGIDTKDTRYWFQLEDLDANYQ